MNDLLRQLKRPFEPKHISWKPGATKESRCLALAYADLRAYMERLDEVCGMDWEVAYEPWEENRIICRLTIVGSMRSSTGEMAAQDEKNEMGGTVAEAQAFKRACAMFGLGRYLYDLPNAWVEFDPKFKRITDAGQKELDGRYTAWYKKTIAALGNIIDVTPRQVDAATGEIVAVPAIEGDVLFEQPERPLASQAQLNHMHALGTQYYGKERWEKARPIWTRDASGGAVETSKDLSPEQIDWVIMCLETRIAKRQEVHAQDNPVQEAA